MTVYPKLTQNNAIIVNTAEFLYTNSIICLSIEIDLALNRIWDAARKAEPLI